MEESLVRAKEGPNGRDEEGKVPRALKHLRGDFLSLQGQTFNMAAVGPQLWGIGEERGGERKRDRERLTREVRSVGRLKRTVNTLAALYQLGDTSFKMLGRFSSSRRIRLLRQEQR